MPQEMKSSWSTQGRLNSDSLKRCVRVILSRFSFRGDVDCDSQHVTNILLSLLSIVGVALQDQLGRGRFGRILQGIFGFVSFCCAKLCCLIVYFDLLMVMP
jgi:hypothetical protein